MPKTELLYSPDCPNVSAARERLHRAMQQVGLAPRWEEHDVSRDDAPIHTRGFGSPTILVNGSDVTGAPPSALGASCRVYAGSDVPGVPPLDVVVAALRASTPTQGVQIGSGLAVVPGALLSTLPVIGCPACWPVYAGALSSLGVPFLMDAAWLRPLTAVGLLVALLALGFRARQRRGYGPLAVGVIASAAILLGKFLFEVDSIVYPATTVLVAASIWNSWPRQKSAAMRDACACPTNNATPGQPSVSPPL